MRALGEAQHRLPVAADGHAAVRREAAPARRAQVRDLARAPRRAALPREDLEPLARRGRRAAGRASTATSTAPGPAGRGDDRRARAVAAGARQRDRERDEDGGAGGGGRGRRDRRAGRRAGCPASASDWLIRAPSIAPPTPATSASGGGGGEHRRRPRMRHPDVAPAPLGGEADRADARAGGERERERAARERERGDLDDRRLGDVQREVRRRVAGDERRRTARARRGSRGTSRAPGTRPTARAARARRRARSAAASAMSTGWKRSWNCGTPKSNSAWKVDRPISSAPVTRACTRRATLRGRPTSKPWRTTIHSPSVLRPAPPIINRWVGPQSVTSSPNSACQIASSGKPISATRAADEHHDAAGAEPQPQRADRPVAAAAGAGEHAVQERGDRDPLQAERRSACAAP